MRWLHAKGLQPTERRRPPPGHHHAGRGQRGHRSPATCSARPSARASRSSTTSTSSTSSTPTSPTSRRSAPSGRPPARSDPHRRRRCRSDHHVEPFDHGPSDGRAGSASPRPPSRRSACPSAAARPVASTTNASVGIVTVASSRAGRRVDDRRPTVVHLDVDRALDRAGDARSRRPRPPGRRPACPPRSGASARAGRRCARRPDRRGCRDGRGRGACPARGANSRGCARRGSRPSCRARSAWSSAGRSRRHRLPPACVRAGARSSSHSAEHLVAGAPTAPFDLVLVELADRVAHVGEGHAGGGRRLEPFEEALGPDDVRQHVLHRPPGQPAGALPRAPRRGRQHTPVNPRHAVTRVSTMAVGTPGGPPVSVLAAFTAGVSRRPARPPAADRPRGGATYTHGP